MEQRGLVSELIKPGFEMKQRLTGSAANMVTIPDSVETFRGGLRDHDTGQVENRVRVACERSAGGLDPTELSSIERDIKNDGSKGDTNGRRVVHGRVN